MKPRLIILSDLWGKGKAGWITGYVELLKDSFEIQYYDCCDIGEIGKSNYIEENLHNQFVNGGIEKAVEHLLKVEKNQIDILAFSIGGTIAWKATLKGLKVRKLFAVSSTRLRYEDETPKGRLKLYYGEKDNFKPTNNWFEKHEIDFKIIENMKHDFYIGNKFITSICKEILK